MKLYNNLETAQPWPPANVETTLDKPLAVAYLDNPPPVVNITLGRQLFVDDFLIESSTLTREFHQPKLLPQPVFEPQTPLEMNDGFCTCACPFNDGLFYDDHDNKFKMWYHAGWFDGIGYAESDDGIHWKRLHEIYPDRQDERVLPAVKGRLRDGSALWLDYAASDPDERYKMMVFFRQFDQEIKYYHRKPKHAHDNPDSVAPDEKILLYKSPDGINWTEVGEAGKSGDNTTFFYNPFTKKWVFSLRTFSALDSRIRTRGYFETPEFFTGSNWKAQDIKFWSRTDIFDFPDPQLGYYTQIYNLDATPYESLMLGMFSVFMGPPNNICELTKMPKINDLKIAFSRDGFHWHRPVHSNFISSSREKGAFDYGYAHSPNGICLVVGDEIYFYVSFFSGQSPNFGSHKYSGGNLGLAKMRRDGFCSLSAKQQDGFVLTKALEYEGDYLFVNCDAAAGELSAELIDDNGNPWPGYERQSCIPVQVDATKMQIRWKAHNTIRQAPNLRIRFWLNNARLYAFWIADDENGRSRGYMAAGGPGFKDGRDI
ncbi:hypothetical protein BTJ39_00775 [Izhakiella australiensis]|uniref:Glycosyl hydrolase family 32 n=1 Tax=Izhakiella australiensis TaxID=1926881 RepID=A0A1S8YS87_9GAMM|nr:hypothetical protein [Izhakiella australiensis]OON41735.1 hypothetical protein BTJ39_00775 [Izhakiella australiensis]